MMPTTLRSWREHGWTIVAATDLGRVRQRQEDAWSVLRGARFAGQTVEVFGVFDGLGGEPRGQEASAAACENLGPELGAAQGIDDVLPALDAHVDRSGGMTTAVLGVFFRARPGHGFVLAAGDSGAYRLAPGGRVQLVIKKDRSGGGITSCLGGGLLTAHSVPLQFGPGETFAFCSDGVDDVVGVTALGEAMGAAREDLEAAVRALFARIEAEGAPDNATLVVARWQ